MDPSGRKFIDRRCEPFSLRRSSTVQRSVEVPSRHTHGLKAHALRHTRYRVLCDRDVISPATFLYRRIRVQDDPKASFAEFVPRHPGSRPPRRLTRSRAPRVTRYREDAERFIEEVRGDDPDLANSLRIEERERGGR